MKLNLKIPPVAQAIIAIGFIWLLDRYMPLYQISFYSQKIVAASLVLIGISIILTGGYTFIKLKTTVDPRTPEKASKLVIIGIYKYSRNPMYLGIAFVLTGLCLYLGGLSTLFVIIAFIIFINSYQIIPEEIALQKKFGDSYAEYIQNVRRWL